MKIRSSVVFSVLLSLLLLLPTFTVFVSAESYVSQSAAGERVIREGVPEEWQSKKGYVGFYKKHIMVYGIPVLSTDDVEDWILYRAYDVLEVYLRKIYFEYPEIIATMIKNKANVIVVGANEYNIDHPDWTASQQALGEAGKTERRGGGGLVTTVLVDDLGIQDPNDWFSDFCGLIHEFSHTMLSYGIGDADNAGAHPDIYEKINSAYEAAYREYVKNGKYSESSYDMNNYHEYFTGQVGRWFNANGTDLKVKHAARKTEREQLKEYDPAIYEICEMLFGEYDVIVPWGTGTDSKLNENETIVDYSPLYEAFSSLSALDGDMFESGYDRLEAALASARDALASGTLDAKAVEAERNKLMSVLSELTPAEGNLAYFAAPSTTFVSEWESITAVNDGKWTKKSGDSSIPHYGSWGNRSASETVTYTWPVPVTLSSSDLYIWTDNYTTNSNIAIPSSYLYEYLGEDGEWHEVTGADDYSVLREREGGGKANIDGFNLTNFDKITATAFRVTLFKSSTADYGVGIVEWRVYGEFASVETDTPDGDAPVVTDPVTTDTDDGGEESGCGSALSNLTILIAFAAAAPVAAIRHKTKRSN